MWFLPWIEFCYIEWSENNSENIFMHSIDSNFLIMLLPDTAAAKINFRILFFFYFLIVYFIALCDKRPLPKLLLILTSFRMADELVFWRRNNKTSSALWGFFKFVSNNADTRKVLRVKNLSKRIFFCKKIYLEKYNINCKMNTLSFGVFLNFYQYKQF